MFSDCLNRWLMPRELLALQGYPIFQQCKPHGERTSFDMQCRESLGLSARRDDRMIEQSGNAMPVPLIGAAILWAWSFTSAGASSSPRPLLLLRPIDRLQVDRLQLTESEDHSNNSDDDHNTNPTVFTSALSASSLAQTSRRELRRTWSQSSNDAADDVRLKRGRLA